MDFNYKQIPLFRLVLAFLIGVVFTIENVYFFSFNALTYATLVLLIVAVSLAFLSRNYSYRRRWVFGLSTSVVMLILGMLTVIVHTEKLSEHHVSKLRPGFYSFAAQIIDAPQEKENAYKCLVKVECVRQYGECEPHSGKVLLYLAKDSLSAGLAYGDNIIGEGHISFIEYPKNPAEFNYKEYMEYQQVQQKVTLGQGRWKLISKGGGSALKAYVYNIRLNVLKLLGASGLSNGSYGVASALLVGYKEALDGETIKAYVGAGAIHVLAVSGLHVGIIYLILLFLLKPLGISNWAKWTRLIVIIVFLLFYGLLTGMTPSVSRAVVMFICIAIAQSFRFQTNIYNTLAFSALILVLINPYVAMMVGFQLSYLAVAGISYLYPRIYGTWQAPNKPLNWLWQLTCVALAAQVATLPLVLFYFHQFAVYFLLSGPIVILGSTVAIWVGLVFLAFSWMPVASSLVAVVLDYAIYAMNCGVAFIENLPFSLIKGIYITSFEVWLLYGIILLGLIWLASARTKWLVGLLLAIVVLSGLQLNEAIQQSKQKMVVVYYAPGSSIVGFIDGRKASVYGDRSFFDSKKKMEYHIKPHWWQIGIKEVSFTSLDSLQGKAANNKSLNLAVLDGSGSYLQLGEAVGGKRYLLLNDNPDVSAKNLIKAYDFDVLLFDASSSDKSIRRWVRQCRELGVEYYDITETGAFILSL